MKLSGVTRTVLLLACAAGALPLGPASAGSPREDGSARCPRFAPAAPDSESGQKDEAPGARTRTVDARTTKDDPIAVDVNVGTSVWVPGVASDVPVVESTEFVNVQVASAARGSTLHARLTWDSPRQVNDLDLRIYDGQGAEIEKSDKPTGQPESRELVSVPARRCEGFTVEVRAFRSLETRATLELWLEGSR